MESLQSSLKISEDFITKEEGFISKVFRLSSHDRGELFNIVQYTLLCIIPVIISLKILKRVIPDEDDNKQSLEILFESILQIIVIFVLFFFIHRIAVFFPTYSKVPYPEVSFFAIVLPTLFLLFTMQTKLGAKLNILYERLMAMIGFKEDKKTNQSEKNHSPQAPRHPQAPVVTNPSHLPTNTMGMNQNYAPPPDMSSHPYGGGNMQSAPEPEMNMMQANNPVSMPSAGGVNNYNQFPNEPMAANDFSPIGGSAFY